MPRQIDLFLGVVLLATCLAAVSCKKDPSRGGIPGRDPQPSMQGHWTGTANDGTSTTTIVMSVTQDMLGIEGTFDALQPGVFGASGTVSGVTTGNSFLVTLNPYTLGCHANIQLGGTNDGAAMAFSFSGVNCASATIHGEGYFAKN